MGWNNAMAWAADLTVGSFSDWRLPVALAPATCTVGIFNCTASELGHLWYSELGNSVGASPPFSVVGTVNTGDFQNLLFDRFSYFWTGTEVDATVAVEFGFGTGRQDIQIKESVVNFPAENQALAVRDGDVLATRHTTQRRARARHFAVDRSGFAGAGGVARRKAVLLG